MDSPETNITHRSDTEPVRETPPTLSEQRDRLAGLEGTPHDLYGALLQLNAETLRQEGAGPGFAGELYANYAAALLRANEMGDVPGVADIRTFFEGRLIDIEDTHLAGMTGTDAPHDDMDGLEPITEPDRQKIPVGFTIPTPEEK